MIRRSFDSDGDYAINSFISGSAATIQAVATRLRLFQGEYFLDLSKGTPWYQNVFIKPAQIPEVERTIRNRITQTEGVSGLTSFSINYDSSTRDASVSFTATTIYGDTFTESDIVGVNV